MSEPKIKNDPKASGDVVTSVENDATTGTVETTPETKLVTFAVNVKHNDKRYKKGDKVEFGPEDVAELTKAGVILTSGE